jgi:hypothetical protein
MSMSVLHVHVHSSCARPCWISMLLVHAVCLWTWACSMSILLVHAVCLYCMTVLLVHNAHPFCMSILPAIAPCPCLHDTCTTCLSNGLSLLHVQAVCPCCLSIMHDLFACQCCMSLLNWRIGSSLIKQPVWCPAVPGSY